MTEHRDNDSTLSRTQEAYMRLKAMAQTVGAGGQMPTFTELRNQFGVSLATLNKAIDLLESQQVLVRRHGVGLFVSPTLGQKHIALVCTSSFFTGPEISPFWQIILDQLRDHVAEQGYVYSLHFAAPDGSEKPFFDEFIRAVEEKRVHGVLGVGLTREASDWLEAQNIPAVGFSPHMKYHVTVDLVGLVRAATLHLALQNCQRIAFWSPFTVAETLAVVFEQTLMESDREFYSGQQRDLRNLKEIEAKRGRLTYWEQGYYHALAVFGTQSEPDAILPDGIVSSSELFTQGILVGLQECSVKIGETVKIAAHANEGSPILKLWERQITRFEVSPAQVAQTMREMLETLLSGEEPVPACVLHRTRMRLPGQASPLLSEMKK